jgi:hypothetical protein
VAEDAVSSEPVSGSDSLLNRENTGNFVDLTLMQQNLSIKSLVIRGH